MGWEGSAGGPKLLQPHLLQAREQCRSQTCSAEIFLGIGIGISLAAQELPWDLEAAQWYLICGISGSVLPLENDVCL